MNFFITISFVTQTGQLFNFDYLLNALQFFILISNIIIKSSTSTQPLGFVIIAAITTFVISYFRIWNKIYLSSFVSNDEWIETLVAPSQLDFYNIVVWMNLCSFISFWIKPFTIEQAYFVRKSMILQFKDFLDNSIEIIFFSLCNPLYVDPTVYSFFTSTPRLCVKFVPIYEVVVPQSGI